MMNPGKPTRIAYSVHFYEDGRTLDLISIGMVSEDGRSLYAINGDLPFNGFQRNGWLMENVAPNLPIQPHNQGGPWNRSHPDFQHVAAKWKIAERVQSFIALETENPQLWGDYAAYGHVALAQLWGTMDDLPHNVPMWTHDLQQRRENLAVNPVPTPYRNYQGRHALWDAQHTMTQLREMDRISGVSILR